MKKYIGIYTKDATKALKNSERLICCTDEDGMIYVTNGYIALKMTGDDYAAIVQPVACCDAGSWCMRNGEKTDEKPFDLVKTFRDAVKAAETAAELARCPLTLTTKKSNNGTGTAAAYYNAAADFVALYDTRYIATVAPSCTFRAPANSAPAIAYFGDQPAALILPIRCDDKTARAVKAFFTEAPDEVTEADKLRDKLARTQDKLTVSDTCAAALQDRVSELTAELDALRAAAGHKPAEDETPQQETPDAKTAAELIAARYADLEGVTVTIKGAQTSAPVVWLTGDTEKHADAIQADGAKWSNKKSAFYFRVA